MQTYSFEYFPPKNEKGEQTLAETRRQLVPLGPAYCSVTFGAGGSTREGTEETVLTVQREDGVPAAPHISCLGTDEADLRQLLDTYRDAGIERVVLLRGDKPLQDTGTSQGTFNYANELVEFVRREYGDRFHIEIGCYPEFHPEAASASDDLEAFKRKAEAGADAAITQYFFNSDAYFRFVESVRAMGVELPIVPGVMPVTNYKQLARFSDICGAEIPRWLRWRLQEKADDPSWIMEYGVDFITEFCQRLLDGGAPGLHFYTLNKAEATKRIWQNLDLPAADGATSEARKAG